MTPALKQASLIAAFGLLSVVAVAGWTRNSRATGFDVNDRAVFGQPSYAQNAAYAPGYVPYANNNCPEPLTVQSAAYAPPVYQNRYRTYSRPRVVRTYVEQDRDYVVRRNKRSTGKSAAIVAGSAGAGAAIGALAGGGKGAAIGALTGGAAGFVYDRLTHNK